MNNQKFKEKAIDIKNSILEKTSVFFDGKKDKELITAVVKYTAYGMVTAVYSFLLASSKALFSTYPLGICLLCSSSQKVGFVFLGCLASALFGQDSFSIIHLLIYTLCILIRFTVCKWLSEDASLFEEAISIRSIIALIGGLASSLYFCVGEGYSIYSLGRLVFTCLVTLGLTAILSGTDKKGHPLHKKAALCALGFCLVSSLSHYSVFGFSLAFACCTCISLYSALTRDMFHSTLFSLICGFACNDPTAAPMFALMALFCSLSRKFKRQTGIPAGTLVGICYGFWAYGITAITYVIPDVVCGSLAVIPIKYLINMSKGEKKEKEPSSEYTEIQNKINIASKKDNKNMSLALNSLAGILNDLSNQLKKPDEKSLEKMAKEVYRVNCSKCNLSSVCSIACNNSCHTVNTFSSNAVKALFDKGYATSDDLPSRLSDGCKYTKDLIFYLNDGYGQLLRRLLTDDKSKAFASGYSAVSKLIDEGEKRRDEEHCIDIELSQSAIGLCRELNIDQSSVYIYGKRIKKVVIKGKGQLPLNVSLLKESFSNLCATPLTHPFTETVEEHWKITMESAPLIKTKMGFATKNCEGEDVCGDHVSTFSCDDGFDYSILSDGMGSGRQAALVSKICCAFGEKLSLCKGSLKTVLETINSYILNQNYECSATMDLLRIDRYTKEGCFVKSGAVSSLVIRGGHVFRISSSTVPIGVVRELNSEQITLPLKEGDIIIITSDGVSPDFESGLFAADIAIKNHSLPPKEIAEKIIAEASQAKRRPDDMSCIVIKILKQEDKTNKSFQKKQ